MTTEADHTKAFIKELFDRDFERVPSKTVSAEGVRLEVWANKQSGLALGYENQPDMANIWLQTSLLPATLPHSVKVTHKVWSEALQKWADEDETRGANSNLKAYQKQFGREPLTRLGIKTPSDAKIILDQLTKGAASRVAKQRAFLLKINGKENAPAGICRPASASDWENGLITMDGDAPRAASYSDKRPAPMPEAGDLVYIWTHEDPSFGNGKGLTATAAISEVTGNGAQVRLKVTGVSLLDRPFGFKDLKSTDQGTALLNDMHAARGSRAWCMSPDERLALEALIESYGSTKAAAIEEANSRYLSDLAKAISAEKDAIDAAEEERKTAVVKARPNQANFRAQAMKRHTGKCVVTKFSVPSVLDAAHVIPHTGNPAFEVPENSLILRKDIHGLFDACLIAINPANGKLLVSGELGGTGYAKLAGRYVDHKLAAEALQYQFKRYQRAQHNLGVAA